MKKLRKMTSVILGVIISCMCLVTPVCAAEESEVAMENANIHECGVTSDIWCYAQTMQPHRHSVSNEPCDHYYAYATSSCSHTGERTVTYVGTCYCGGWLYSVNCKACGAFVGALCTNFCDNWPAL